MVDEPVQIGGGGGGGRGAYKSIMGWSAIFKMVDQSTIRLYASGGGGGVHRYKIVCGEKLDVNN